ncbi:MAG: hypothetical protein ABEJ59_05200 [Halanaeroarchaeum sp.]
MHTRTVEQVESWDARPFSGGFRELHQLADDDFSGAVVADDVWSFFLNGRVVGVFQGDIDDFEHADGTRYTAPHPSLPLLFSMQERGGQTQAKYFTNDTSVSATDRTLQDANFTGYIELSENVLSGDYYVVYYGGKGMSAAFIGQSDRLVTGDEAFERANDEVGVFEVRKVSMNITEIPAAAEEESATDAGESSTQTPIAVEEAEPSADESDPTASAPTNGASEGPTEGARRYPEDARDDAADPSAPATESSPTEPPESTADEDATAGADPTESAAGETSRSETTDAATGTPADASDEPVPDASNASAADASADPDDTPNAPPADRPAGADAEEPVDDRSEHERAVAEWAKKDRDEARRAAGDEDPFREEAAWRETTSIPALDPDESRSATEDRQQSQSAARRSQGQASNASVNRRPPESEGTNRQARSDAANRRAREERTTEPSTGAQQNAAAVKKLQRAVQQRDERIDALETELSEAESGRERLEERIESLQAERDDLQERVADLEASLESTQSTGGSAASAPDVDPSRALSETNLFVRYESKGKPTLTALEERQVDPSAIDENLRLEHHTQFEADEVTVEGRPFEQFLADSAPYRFVDWLVREYPYELLESGARAQLQAVYDAIPRLDRIEFDGTVETTSPEGEASTSQFDVVVRDRMGEPLLVAEINDSRDPVRGDAMESLVTNATTVGEGNESLAGAFYVTASFFEPGALEHAQTAADEGGFFSRSDRASFVKTGRKSGYHLCLVEDRQDAFHLTVPEL